MTTKHTPGPWHVESGPLKTRTGEPAEWAITCSKGPIALLSEDDTTGPRYERDANARLIASAPALLEALLWVRENPDHAIGNEDHSDHCPDCRRILRAIAAATGEGER